MLKEIEQQVLARIAKGLPDADVSVVLRRLRTEDVFQREQHTITKDRLVRWRRLPITFAIRIAVRTKPSGDSIKAVRDARELLLEQVARIAHLLGDPDVRSGQAFQSAFTDIPDDPLEDAAHGLAVESFVLARAAIADAPADGVIVAKLRYQGSGSIWPPGEVSKAEGRIQEVDPLGKLAEGNAALPSVPFPGRIPS
jgi:hypothetical protein